MLTIERIQIDSAGSAMITDRERPRFSFSLSSDRQGSRLQSSRLRVTEGDRLCWDSGLMTDGKQISIVYRGEALSPFTRYAVTVTAADNFGDMAEDTAFFSTGRLGLPWQAHWITDLGLTVPDKSSPAPLLFRRRFSLEERPVHSFLTVTAMGIYDLCLNGRKLGDRYFAPGFTSYHHQLAYQFHEDLPLQAGENDLRVRVGAGWAVGAFTFNRHNRTYADRQSLLLELHLIFASGREEILSTDESFEVSRDGVLRFADWYDGEIYDARIDEDALTYHPADLIPPPVTGKILAEYGAPVRAIDRIEPVSVFSSPTGERIYDFGQNIAGILDADIRGHAGQTLFFRHAEVLQDGALFTKPLRTAKASVRYTCREGDQHYRPSMTYMGFRYIGVRGIAEEDLKLSVLVLSSVTGETGSFSCSDERLNTLQQNILRSGRANFMDIPTDCPQRDERMGWTGDLAVFARTACFNFDMSRFLGKWLRDLSSEQTEDGALPMTCPKAEDGWKKRAVGCWGDSCILVPWAEYLARGDEELLRDCYPMMKKFLAACEHRAELFSAGKHRRIISLPFQFGDWCAPDEDFMHWILKGKWVATAYFAGSCRIVSEIAKILGEKDDEAYYRGLFEEINDAYLSLLCDRTGRLKKEFQTACVLPLAFSMAEGSRERVMAKQLARLVREAGYSPRTGFPGTPYLLFALADHGEEETAFRTLLNESRPGWLCAVRAGATSIWERWDAIRPDGSVNAGEHGGDGGMVSFNHYANGAVGDFLYRRIAGLEPTAGGYRSFNVAPLAGFGITRAEARVMTPYGLISSAWKIEGDHITAELTVPVSTTCTLILPGRKPELFESGHFSVTAALPQKGNIHG